MPLEATHTSDLTIYKNRLYAIDFYSDFIYEFKIFEEDGFIGLDFQKKTKVALEDKKFGSFAIIEKKNLTYLLATSFNDDNRIWVFNFEDLFVKQLGFEDSLVFETEGSFFTQGLYYQKNKNRLYISVNRFGRDFIFKIKIDDFLLNKDINKSIERVYLAPGRMVEDIYLDGEYLYTSDEETNKIYKASIKHQKEVDLRDVFNLKDYKFYNKLLSHRNRVQDFQENTLDGFISVLRTGIKYIEIDIRLSADNIYFTYHDPFFKHGYRKFKFYDKTLNEIRRERYKNKKMRISTLESILEYFSKYRQDEQILSIDVKDFGEEEVLVDMLEKFNVINYVEFYTWTPQVIFKLDEIFKKRNISRPIHFSHVRTDSIFRYILIPQFLNWKKYFLVFADFVLIGNHNYKTELGRYARGYRHVPYFFHIPKDLISVLQKHNGGICVSAKSRNFPKIGLGYFRKMKKLGLRTSAFGPIFGILKINKKIYFENLAKEDGIDIVFMDDLDDIL